MGTLITFYKKFRYPKLLLIVVSIILAYILFQNESFQHLVLNLGAYSYLGIFLAGMMFAFGFTTAFAVAFFLTLNGAVNPIDTALVAGFGAVAADFTIFKAVKMNLMDEFRKIKHLHLFRSFSRVYRESPFFRVKTYLTLVVAGIIIASPLPDEIGVSILAGFTEIDTKTFAIISYVLNSLGIFIILMLSHL